jgi:hypothetical protein
MSPGSTPAGYYEKVYAALQHWLSGVLPFTAPFFSNREIPGTGADVTR